MKKDSLGDRMKGYEKVTQHILTPKTPVILRLDGKAFHTYTRGFPKPFCTTMINGMVYAAVNTAKHISGFKIGYVQSDEVSLAFMDYENFNTQPWFKNKIQKIVSVAASIMTAHFNDYMGSSQNQKFAYFDARAFSIPKHEVPNYFLWRAKDWNRNSVQMLARAHFSHKQLNNKNVTMMHEMLKEKGIFWDDLRNVEKFGTFLFKEQEIIPRTNIEPNFPAIYESIGSSFEYPE
jgi:tRNA(His) guanylyltransferase